MSPFRGSEPEPIAPATVRYFKVGRRDLVYLKFILEGYEGMSTLSTVEPKEGVVRLSIPGGFEADVESLLAAVGTEIPVHEVTFELKETADA